MSKRISRRAWLTSVPALGGLLLTGCSRETFVPPRVRGGLIGAADVLTMSTNRLLLSGQPLAREFPRSEIADPFPTWNQTNPRNAEYQRHLSERFRNWRLPITGLVERPLRAVARRDQKPPCAHANHRARVRTGLVGDRRMDRRATSAGARSGGRRHAGSALRCHRHLRPMVPVIRSVRGRASSDDPCLRPEWPRPTERQRRAAPPSRRTAVRIQEPQIPEIDPGCRLDRRLRQRHRWNQLRLRLPLVRRRLSHYRCVFGGAAAP